MQRIFPAGDGDERETLTGWLDWQRATVHLKVADLSEEDAYRALLPASPTMTVAGLLSHLRWTEWGWFARSFPALASDRPRPPDGGGGWSFDRLPIARLIDEYRAECESSRSIVAALDLGTPQEFTPAEFTAVNLRWIVAHMIDETARHVGHLDILRETLDGTRGY